MDHEAAIPHVLRVTPIVRPEVRSLCARPYPGHPKGCPNLGRRPDCPPSARPVAEVLDLDRPVWAIWSRFDLSAHVERMRQRHPHWSPRQLACCRYWQPTARARLRRIIEQFAAQRPELVVLTTPEACGVDVTATMAGAGVRLEWPPVRWTHQVALAGTPRGPAGPEWAR